MLGEIILAGSMMIMDPDSPETLIGRRVSIAARHGGLAPKETDGKIGRVSQSAWFGKERFFLVDIDGWIGIWVPAEALRPLR